MEATLDLDVLSESSKGEVVTEKITEELDDILDEVVSLAKTEESQKPVLDNMGSEGEESVDETDFAMQTGDYVELEINLPIEATESQAKKTPLAEATKSAFDALIDAENEVMDALGKKAGANGSPDASSKVKEKDPCYKTTDKNLAEDSKTTEDSLCDAPVENAVSDETSDKLPAHSEKSSEESLGSRDSKTLISQGSTDQLADVLSKKIEATIARLVEERLSIIVERSIAEKLDRIFINI